MMISVKGTNSLPNRPVSCSIIVKEGPRVGSPYLGDFPPDRIPKATNDVNIHFSYVYWTVHHLDRNTNTHRSRYVITHTHDIKIYSGNIKNTLHTSELKNRRTTQQPIFTETRLLKQPHTLLLITRF